MNLRTLLILGALCAFGPLAIDFYLPSFPTLAQQFATDVEHIQLSLAAYFVGIAIGQLFHGPLADRFGRRVPLLVGVALFAVGSLACAIAPSLEWLIAARFVQALGGCAGMVITRAVVRDLCDPLVSAKVFSQLVLVMGLAPILAPLGGGLLLNTLGWPWIFHSLAIFATLCLLAVLRWLPETRPQELPPAPLSGAFGQYRALLGNASFMGYSLAGGVAMAGMFAYIAGSPFVFIELVRRAGRALRLAVRQQCGRFRDHGPDQCAAGAGGWAGGVVATRGAGVPEQRLVPAGAGVVATGAALAAAGAAVHLRRQPGLSAAQRHGLRHGRAGAACRQCLGVAGEHAVHRGRQRLGAGGLPA